MSKIALIGLHNLHLMQFLYKYTDVLDANGVEYDVLYWDRDMDPNIKYKEFKGNKIVFSYKISNYQPKYKKIVGYMKCIKFVLDVLKSKKYDKVILLTTQTALPLYVFSKHIRNSMYIYDYRDLTYENVPICKKIIRRMIDNSEFTAISSLGFTQVLGASEKYVLSHNVSNLKVEKADAIKYEKIKLVYWGMIRQLVFNKKVCDAFGNDRRFEVFYHGEGYNVELEDYCKEKGYENVYFTGRYMVHQIRDFAREANVLMNLYENDAQQKLALTVKLYDGIRYGLPMLISDKSYMAEMMSGNASVLSVDANQIDVEEIYAWYQGVNNQKYPYEDIVNQIMKDESLFVEALMNFVRKEK